MLYIIILQNVPDYQDAIERILKKAPQNEVLLVVEMAGVEPASEG